MYELNVKPHVDKIFEKLSKRNPKQFSIINKKLEEIVQNPHHFKNLRAPMQYLKRVHIDKSFILVFSVNEETKTIVIEDFDHHDKIYL